jgi:hypothetical protein
LERLTMLRDYDARSTDIAPAAVILHFAVLVPALAKPAIDLATLAPEVREEVARTRPQGMGGQHASPWHPGLFTSMGLPHSIQRTF